MNKELYTILENLYKLMEEERDALVINDGEKVSEILNSKIEIMEEIAKYKGHNFKEDRDVVNLIEKINELQDINLMLTKQVLDYNENLMEAVSRGLEEKSGTYSPSGDYKKTTSSLIDKSI